MAKLQTTCDLQNTPHRCVRRRLHHSLVALAAAAALVWAGTAAPESACAENAPDGAIGISAARASTDASVGDYRCVDKSKVYFGRPSLFRRPCTVSSDRIYRQIPAYKEILEKGLTDKDPRYHLLMRKAGKVFAKAVKSMARSRKHDLVAEQGAVEAAKDGVAAVPDCTQDTIDALDN